LLSSIDPHIAAGGLLYDGKLNFDYRIGINLDKHKIDRDLAQQLMEEIKQVRSCIGSVT